MKLTLTRDVEEFAGRTRDLFESRAIECNLIASICAGVRAGRYPQSVPLFAYGVEGEEVRFAALRTPPWDMLATAVDQLTADELIRRWLADDPELPGVGGPPGAARAVAAEWAKETGGTMRCSARELAYVLERVTEPPRPAPGTLRLARADERALVTDWMRAFARESAAFPEERAHNLVEGRTIELGLWVWDQSGPVSMLATTPPIARAVRIGPVYTPPEYRRRGYAGTAVAAASRNALAGGAQRCVLFTDATNPTANKIYAEVGYRHFGEHEEYEFKRG